MNLTRHQWFAGMKVATTHAIAKVLSRNTTLAEEIAVACWKSAGFCWCRRGQNHLCCGHFHA